MSKKDYCVNQVHAANVCYYTIDGENMHGFHKVFSSLGKNEYANDIDIKGSSSVPT